MEFAEHLTALLSEGRTLGAVAHRAGSDAAVPSCPEWSVTDLVVHVGGVHRWVAMIVGEERTEFPSREERAACGVVGQGVDLDDWYGEGLEQVADALARAPAGLAVPTFVPGLAPREFWARRMAHETFVHRLDAELAAGGAVGTAEVGLAADGVDELLEFLPARVGRRGGLQADPARTLAVHADEGRSWTLRFGPDGMTSTGGAEGEGDVVLRGPVAALHAALWNRAGWSAVTASGDQAVLELWRADARI